MPYTTQDIRNIALVGQAGAGKTLLAEALLAQSGAIRSKGSLARGTTVCDFDPQEKALLHSLDAAICGFETQGRRVNMIDTPGYPDFLGRTLSALESVETAVVVVSAVNGVEPMTQRMMDFARTRGLCRLIVVNKPEPGELDGEFVTRMRNYRCESATFRMNVALSELPDFNARRGAADAAGPARSDGETSRRDAEGCEAGAAGDGGLLRQALQRAEGPLQHHGPHREPVNGAAIRCQRKRAAKAALSFCRSRPL